MACVTLLPSPTGAKLMVFASLADPAGIADGVLSVRQGTKGKARKKNLQRFWERIRPNCEALSPGGRLPLHNGSEDDGEDGTTRRRTALGCRILSRIR